MNRISQFKLFLFQAKWHWMLYATDDRGQHVVRKGFCQYEELALVLGLLAWAWYDIKRMVRKMKGGN